MIEEAHESEIVSLAYNRVRKEIYSCADGDKVIKVGFVALVMPALTHRLYRLAPHGCSICLHTEVQTLCMSAFF